MFRKIIGLFFILATLSLTSQAQVGGMRLALTNLTTIPDTIFSGDVYSLTFEVQNRGTEAVANGDYVGLMLSVDHDPAQLVGQAVKIEGDWFPWQTRTITIPAYQFNAGRFGGGPASDIIVWPTVMALPSMTLDSMIRPVYFVSTSAFKVAHNFIKGLSVNIDLNTTYSIEINTENIGLQPNQKEIEFFAQIDNRTPIVLETVNKMLPVGDQTSIFVQSFKILDLDKNFVYTSMEDHFVTIGAREKGKSNASQKAVYPLKSGVFPVELLNFQAKAITTENLIEVTWATANELNNKEFTIEKMDRVNNKFVTIETVLSQGNSNSIQTYRLIDKHPELGRNLYRLTQIDIDGTARVLNTAEVMFNLDEPYQIVSIAPIPCKDMLNFSFFNNATQDLTVEIYSLEGRKMLTQKTDKQASQISLSVDMSPFASGVYIYKVTGKDKHETGRFIKE